MTDSPIFRTVASAPANFAALLQQGVEKAADFQKIALDLYAHQAADIIDSWKKVSFPVPGFSMIDIAGQGMQYFVQMQKNMLDLVVQQSVRGIDVIRTQAPAVGPERPDIDSMDTLIPDQESDAAVATKMVDKIVAELAEKPDQPVVHHAAMQQKAQKAHASKRSHAAKQP